MRVGVILEVDAEVAGATRPAELVQEFLVNLERGQVLEKRAIAPAVDGCVNPFGGQAVVSGDARDVLPHSPASSQSNDLLDDCTRVEPGIQAAPARQRTSERSRAPRARLVRRVRSAHRAVRSAEHAS
jgi:hypothetical protein